MSFVDQLFGAVLQTSANELQNRRQADAAESAQNFSAQQYASRYQTTVQDMKAAGINPMLAYGSGPGNAPSGVMAQTTNPGKDVNAARLASESVNLIQAQAEAARASAAASAAQADKTKAETPSSGPGSLGDATLANLTAQNNRIAEEIVLISRNAANATQQGHVLGATVSQLEESVRLMKLQGKTQTEQAEQLRAIVLKIKNEVGLSALELAAKNSSGNFGNISNEYKLVADVLTDMIPSVGNIFSKNRKRGGWSSTERSDGKGNRSMETREWGEQ